MSAHRHFRFGSASRNTATRIDFVGVGLQPRQLGMTEVMRLQEPGHDLSCPYGRKIGNEDRVLLRLGEHLERGMCIIGKRRAGVSAAPRTK
jgi:hypothetical protein